MMTEHHGVQGGWMDELDVAVFNRVVAGAKRKAPTVYLLRPTQSNGK